MDYVRIEERLRELAPDSGDTLSKAVNYALFGGGKRLRPRLVIAAAEALGQKPAVAIDPACAIEMIHTYSLIHDDLPSMDNDDFRRGRPAVHKAFPEGIAILAGDALLTEAFRVLSGACDLSGDQKIRLTATLALRAGKEGMAGGQAMDVLSAGLEISPDLLRQINQKKTGDLFGCSLEFGAIIANAGRRIENLLMRIGRQFGFAYQILDDLQDGQKDAQAACRQLLKQTVDDVFDLLSQLPCDSGPIKSILLSIVR